MAADTQQYGVDPSQGGQPVPMPQVDPGSPPADPMLAGPGAGDAVDQEEFETRERVQLTVLLTIESLAKGSQVGEGASNTDYVEGMARAGDAWGRVYAALEAAEQKDDDAPPSSQQGQMQFGTGGNVPSPSQGMGA